MAASGGLPEVAISGLRSDVARRRWIRWLKRGLLAVAALLVVLLLVGAVYEIASQRRAAERYPAFGTLVDIGGRRIHLDCRGYGAPTAVLEAGLSFNGSLDWIPVHDALAAKTRVCSYDRAGIMWSDPKNSSQNGDAVAQDLHAALSAAGERGPFVLVAHSLGGPYAMIYTRKYPKDVVGLVLVDASHPDQSARLKQAGVTMSDPESSLLMKTLASLRWTGLPRLMMQSNDAGIPLEVRKHANAYAGASIAGVNAEMAGFQKTMRDAGAARDLGDRPLRVLTAMKPLSETELSAAGLSKGDGPIIRKVWRDLHDEEARWSSRGVQRRLADSSHYVAWDRPDAVIAAVGEVVDTVRADQAAAKTK